MKKRSIVWVCVLVAFACLSALLWHLQQMPTRAGRISDKDISETVKRIRGGSDVPVPAPIKPVPLNQPVRLAIGGLGRSNDEQNRQLEDVVLTDLTGTPGLEMVERQSLDKVLRELNLSISHLVRAQDAVRVGKLLKTDWFLLGTGANINGTNFIVIRLVDSHTGIMRDATVFSTDGSQVKLAADIAGFVRQCRQEAVNPKAKVYLAVGTFRDLSLNNRQAAFPAQLRAYLTAAYQGGNATLLEREAAEVLWRELRLDLAGLTETGPGQRQPLQSAYWFVDADYQSYETTNFQVEVSLKINRVFGRISTLTLRGPPDRRLFGMIKDAIDKKMRQDVSPILLSLASEVDAQMSAGKELSGFKGGWGFYASDLIHVGYYQGLDEQEFAKRRRNDMEAIKAFETVLLLQPTNREAKLYLAACYRKPTIARMEEARSLYREILKEPLQDQWTGIAEGALVASFDWSDPDERRRWFEAAAQDVTNSAVANFFRQQAAPASQNELPDGTKEAEKTAEEKLLKAMPDWNQFRGGDLSRFYVMFWDFVKGYGTNTEAAATRLVELLPQLRAEATNFEPHLLACILSFQTNTNNPVVPAFERSFEHCMENPQGIFQPQLYFSLLPEAGTWCGSHKLFGLAERIIDARTRAASLGIWIRPDDQDRVELAYECLTNKCWEPALKIFESYSNMPVLMLNQGPWGCAETPALTGKEADYCREKLGLPVARDPREFSMGNTGVMLCRCSTFAIDEAGLWIASGSQLLHLDLELRTNLIVDLPKDADTPVTTLDIGTDKIWIGTGGDGLIEFDKASRQCRRLTITDGLLMNQICSTCLSGNTLWIGYGYKGDSVPWGSAHPTDAGGIGLLNLSSHQFISFTPSLARGADSFTHVNRYPHQEPFDQAPRRAVFAITAGQSGDIWFVPRGEGLRRFQSRSNIWETVLPGTYVCCLAVDADQLYAGQFRGMSGDAKGASFGLKTFDFRGGAWRDFPAVEGLPRNAISTLARDGSDLWIAGMGYLAWVDPVQDVIKKFANIPAYCVDKIQVGGGYVWAQYNGYLYRAPLSVIEDSASTATRSSQREFIQTNFAKLVPFRFQKDANGAASLQRLNVRGNMIERGRMYYCGFKFTVPAWADGNLKLMYVMAKTEAEKNFSVTYMNSDIIPENGPSVGSFEFLREDLASYPQLGARFPYTRKVTTQDFDVNHLEPGKTYGIWFEFDNKNLSDITFAMTIDSPRGTKEFGTLPLR